jgi:hypothetical protein
MKSQTGLTKLKRPFCKSKRFWISMILRYYQLTNPEIRNSRVKATMPALSLPGIDRKKMNEMFSSLYQLLITTEKPLLAKPQVTHIMNTYHEYLYSA